MKKHTLRKILVQTAFLFVTVLSLTTAVASQTAVNPGALDTTFGDGGIALAYSPGYQLYYAYAMAIQPDGKIVVVGEGVDSSHGWNWESAVVRFNPDGSLDTSLGGTGIVINPVGQGFYSVAIQPDGKIVVVSSVAAGTFGVVRYNPNGSLDTSFNGSGIVLTQVGDSGGPSSVAIQTDGKIVVAGSKGTDSFAIVRYNPNGSLDTSFNGSGIVLTLIGYSGGRGPSSVAIQTDGKIVVVGSKNGNDSFAIVRYNPNGSLDTSFNGTGIVTTSVGNHGVASNLAIQTDGKIVVAGSEFLSTDFAVVRYNPDGSFDTSFGGTGEIHIPVGDGRDDARSVTIQPNGKIVVAGITFIDGDSAFATGRLNADGSVDTSFNGTGIVITSIGKRYNDAYYDEGGSVALQADGKIVVAGDTGPDEFKSFVVVRYQGDSATPAPTPSPSPSPSPTPSACVNPIDCPEFFVRQHYRDFLSREAEAAGLDDWERVLANCPSGDLECFHQARLTVSAAFFGSPEFQLKGYFAFRFYRAAFNRLPLYDEIIADMQSLNGQSPAEVYANRAAFTNSFGQRAEFLNRFGALSNADYVAALLSQYGLTSVTTSGPLQPEDPGKITLSQAELIAQLDSGMLTRVQVLRAIADSDEVFQLEFNRAFVAMQYYGYLRRAPEPDGYNAWLTYLNAHPTDFREMVRGFVDSIEYRRRFGTP